tara:strand:- start:6052 stop:6378 length:327 start_codon:yes stop_codon:yes gene_type:complete
MTFVLKKTDSIKWPVTVQKATDGGKFKEHKFDAVFKEIGRDRFNQLIEEGDQALTDEILIGWEKVQDEEGNEVEFNEENKTIMLDNFTVIKAVIEAYGQLMMGGAAKN